MANITVKVNPVTTNKVKQVTAGQILKNFELNDLKNVDTTTVTPSGDTIVFDAQLRN